MDFHQIFRISLPQEDLELIKFWRYLATAVVILMLVGFWGLKICGC